MEFGKTQESFIYDVILRKENITLDCDTNLLLEAHVNSIWRHLNNHVAKQQALLSIQVFVVIECLKSINQNFAFLNLGRWNSWLFSHRLYTV